jgi:hypothetical protein
VPTDVRYSETQTWTICMTALAGPSSGQSAGPLSATRVPVANRMAKDWPRLITRRR